MRNPSETGWLTYTSCRKKSQMIFEFVITSLATILDFRLKTSLIVKYNYLETFPKNFTRFGSDLASWNNFRQTTTKKKLTIVG